MDDVINNSAMALIRSTRPHAELKPWIKAFGDDLYGRTRAGLVAAQILRRSRRRRLAGILRAESYISVEKRWAVIARAKLRYLASGRERPNNSTSALAGLVAVLGLAPFLYLHESNQQLVATLKAVAGQQPRPVRDVIAAVDVALGDLATAPYR